MTNSNSNPIEGGKAPCVLKAVPCVQDPSAQLTQLDWLGNLSGLLGAVEDCFVTNTSEVYNENLRAWNTSSGAASTEAGHNGRPDPDFNPYPERGPHKLPGVCSLTWCDDRWYMHLLLEVVECN